MSLLDWLRGGSRLTEDAEPPPVLSERVAAQDAPAAASVEPTPERLPGTFCEGCDAKLPRGTKQWYDRWYLCVRCKARSVRSGWVPPETP